MLKKKYAFLHLYYHIKTPIVGQRAWETADAPARKVGKNEDAGILLSTTAQPSIPTAPCAGVSSSIASVLLHHGRVVLRASAITVKTLRPTGRTLKPLERISWRETRPLLMENLSKNRLRRRIALRGRGILPDTRLQAAGATSSAANAVVPAVSRSIANVSKIQLSVTRTAAVPIVRTLIHLRLNLRVQDLTMRQKHSLLSKE